jgi:hypothetical protein
MDGIALFERHLGNPPRHPKAELDLPDVDIAVEHEGGVVLRPEPEFDLQVEREEGCRASGGQHERRDGDAQGFTPHPPFGSTISMAIGVSGEWQHAGSEVLATTLDLP